jgi:hypothetical protein
MTEETNQPINTESVGQEAAPSPQPAPDLNLSDLLAVKNIIEVATSRGAFKAAELEAVGKTFNKLNTFLESVSKKEA